MPRKKSRVRVYKPRSAKMWLEPLEKRELLAGPDFLAPTLGSSHPSPMGKGHALAPKPEEPLGGTIDYDSKPAPKSSPKRSKGGDDVIVFTV